MRRFLSLICILLIMTMPIVTAQSLSVQQFAGRDGVRNVAKTTDTLTIRAQVTIPNDPDITPNQVRLITSEGISYFFTTCTPQVGGAICTLNYDLVGVGGVDDYTIAAFNDDNVQVTQAVEELVNDFIDPEMLTFYAEKEILGPGPVKISYRAEDYSFVPGDTEACAGVGNVKIFENTQSSGFRASIPGTTRVNDCTVEGEYSYTPQNTGNVTLCAVAFDRIGKTSAPLCTSIYVDRMAPAIRGFRIAAYDGATLYTIPPEGMSASVEVRIEDPSLDVNSVRADFSRLAGAAYSDRGPNDIGIAPLRTVIWHDIPITSVSPCEFTVRAADDLGNTVSQKLTCTIVSDTSPPEAISMSTGFTSGDGTPLLGIQGTLTVLFREKGMARSEAFLDTHNLGLGIRRADFCEPLGADWACRWKLPANVPAGRYSATVVTSTRDDLGNQLQAPASYAFDYDSTPPSITGGPRISIFHANNDYGDKLVHGDVIEVEYDVSGAYGGVANVSDFGAATLVPASCDASTCTFAFTVERSGGFTGKALMRITDDAGNFVEQTRQFEVFDVLDEPNPNYWKSSVTCTPKVLDRSSTVLVNHQVYCRIKLTPYSNEKKVEVVATGMGPWKQCTGDIQTSVAAPPELINNGYKSREPYMRVLLPTREFPEAQFNLTCPMYILTQVGDGFTSYPETENVTMQIAFGDSPIGSMSENIDEKIEEAVDDAQRFGKWLDALNKFFDVANKICQLRQMFWNIAAALEVIHVTMSALSISTKFLGAPVEPGRQAWCQAKEQYVTFLGKPGQGIDSFLQPFCGFLNCQQVNTELTGPIDTDIVPGATEFVNQQGEGPIAGEPGQPPIINVKDSIVWSVATLCVPGIIYNVDKYRQIQCRYATCLKREVKDSGVPISVCEDEKAYLTCAYVWGQAFAAIPYTAITQYWINTVKEWLSNPFAALAALIGAFCEAHCGTSYGTINIGCSFAKVFESVGRVIDDVQSVKTDDFFKVGQGPCQQLEDLEDEE